MGPTGIGGSYISEKVPVRGTRHVGTGVRSAYPYHLDEFPYRMECGTLNVMDVPGLHAGHHDVYAAIEDRRFVDAFKEKMQSEPMFDVVQFLTEFYGVAERPKGEHKPFSNLDLD